MQRNTPPIFTKPLAIVLSLVAIFPWYSFMTGSMIYSRAFKFYSALLVFTIITVSSGLLFLRFRSIFPYSTTLLNVVDVLHDTGGAIFLIITLLGSSFWNMHTWKQFLWKTEKTRNSIYSAWLFPAGNITMLVLIFLDCLQNKNSHIFYYTIFFIYRYVYILVAHTVFICVDTIRYKYKSINDMFYFQPRDIVNRNMTHKFRNIRILYLESNEFTQNFNTLFGWPLLLLSFYAVIETQDVFTFVLQTKIGWGDRYKMNTTTLFLNIAYILELLISLIAVIINCDLVVQEAEKSLTNCYALKQMVTIFPNELKELENLEKIIKDTTPKLTAAGFFELRKSTLLSLLGTITTYLIVVLQFNSL